MKRKTFVPLREQTVNMEPRPVTTDQVDAVLNASGALDERMEKLRDLRQKHADWVNRQPETDGRPLMRYIDDGMLRLLRQGDLSEVEAA
ncbi:hypothetical protein [Henriciella mobilis]|uniref:Uncharacterized protein n=1 Tax=Henriciella mobilis TaxID=2305467 RepID=A0A399R970_9PROT|nr:hypothetical protein [Henriciella mobilis]RIJ15567.1 hypothetical protein D1231_12560 [Henriciella mobilis]RIJ19031.1 hypothetical protein D1227_18910 [Henriciella mobilis]RIJ27980.1 hypothetical protein D1223_11190 [Henriciella mobilis]